MFRAGDQVPVTPFSEVVGNGLKVLPVQIGATWVNCATVFGVTVMVKVVLAAHNPAAGVKV